MKFVVFLLLITLMGINSKRDGPDRNQLTEKFCWDIHEFEFPTNRREQAIATESFIPNRNGISAIGVWRDKMFVGIYRLRKGVASSLNYFSLNTTDKSPILIPYPSFEANYVNEDPNNRTVSLPSPLSVINTGPFKIDKCDRLWVIDSGFSDHFGDKRWIATPAIVIFDLNSDTLIRRIEIPEQFVTPFTALVQIVLDFDGDTCEDVHAYVADFFRSIIVYSFKQDRTWQVEHNFMGSNPHEGNFVYKHLNYQWNYGIYALAISDRQPDGSKRVYFAPLSSTTVYYVSNQVLKDEHYTLRNYYYDFHILGGNGKYGQLSSLIYDEKSGSLFSAMFSGDTVGCWNTNLPHYSMNTVHKTSALFYPFALDIDSNHNLWVLSYLAPLVAYEEFQPGVKNVCIFKEPVEQAIAGTNCKISKA